MYVPLNVDDVDYDHGTKRLSKALARHLEAQHPKLIVSSQKKELRKGKVLIDWSQNDEHKTTVSACTRCGRASGRRCRRRSRGTRSRRAIRTRSCSRPATCWSAVEERGDLFAPVARARSRTPARSLLSPLPFGAEWSTGDLARQIAALGGGTGHRGGASVRRRRAVAPRWSRRWPATRGLALADAHAAGGGGEPRRVGGREPRRRSSQILDPVAARLDERLAFAGPLAGALRAGASATLAAEAGLVMGYLSLAGARPVRRVAAGRRRPTPRLLFVGPNLAGAVRDLDVDADAFGRWICAHELTHVFQFQGVPWLREHMAGLLRRYVETLEVRIEKRRGRRAAVAAGSAAARRARSARAGSRRSCRARNSGH